MNFGNGLTSSRKYFCSDFCASVCTAGIIIYLRQGGYVIVVYFCLSVSLSVSNFVRKLLNGLHEILRESSWQWADEQMIKFWWRSRLRIRIATALRRALTEVCTVSVLSLAMAALRSRCGHYIFALWFLSSIFFYS